MKRNREGKKIQTLTHQANNEVCHVLKTTTILLLLAGAPHGKKEMTHKGSQKKLPEAKVDEGLERDYSTKVYTCKRDPQE
jgi:hypothetical protein